MNSNLDINALSLDDVLEEYKILHERHQRLKEQSEQDAQRIHELKRSLDTANAAEAYLTQELEHLAAQAQCTEPAADPRMQKELEELRRNYNALRLEHDTLQMDFEAKAQEAKHLQSKLESAARENELSAVQKANSDSESENRLNILEQENSDLLLKLEEHEENSVQHTFALAEKEKTIAVLLDQVNCLEENMRCKRDELEEKMQMLETAQEELVETNAKLALLTSAPENAAAKGNSLFAEVDDQRQVMKQMLASQKKSYLQMKKIYTESESEIRRLKRENIAMHTELRACSAIFCSADKTFQNKLNERIRHLMAQNNTLEHKLTTMQEYLRKLANEKSVIWLDSMLDFCKRETDELKSQMHSTYIQKASLEEQLRNMQQEMARWRFESLKSRCVLIDRENLLTEHKISFKPMLALEFNIKEAELKAALPRIVCVPNEAQLTPKMESPAVVEVPIKIEVIEVMDTPIKPDLNAIETIELLDTPLTAANPFKKGTPVKPRLGLIKVKRQQDLCQLVAEKAFKVEPNTLDAEQAEAAAAAAKDEPAAATAEDEPAAAAAVDEPAAATAKVEPVAGAAEVELIPAKPMLKGTPVKFSKIAVKLSDSDEEDIRTLTKYKPKRKGTPVKPKIKTLDEYDGQEVVKPLRKGTPVKPRLPKLESPMIDKTNTEIRSILSKERDVFADDNKKNVHFTTNKPTVHNLSPQRVTDSGKENKPFATGSTATKPKSKTIIRHIVVSAKKPQPTFK